MPLPSTQRRSRRVETWVFSCLLALAFSGIARAQSREEIQAWVDWCEQQGGHVVKGGEPYCEPPAQASSGASLTQGQQSMLNMAGQLGSAIGNAIRESIERSRREAELRRMQTAWEENRARQFAVGERIRLRERQRQINESLLAGMQGLVGNSELGLVRVERQELRLRNRDEIFGAPSNGTGSSAHDVVVAGSIAAPRAPDDVEGRAVSPGGPEAVRAAWDDYLAALQRKHRTEAELISATQRRDDVRIVVQEASRQVEIERARPHPAQAPATSGDDRLAEAERLLAAATALDEKASRELDEAKGAAERAQAELSQAERRAADTGTPAPKAPTP